MKKLFLLLTFILTIGVTTLNVFAMDECSTEIQVETNESMLIEIDSENKDILPEQTQLQINGTGSFNLSYNEPGIYEYTIKQIPGTDPAIEYDTTIYNVYVSILYNDANKLTATITANPKDTTEKPDVIKFVNTPKESETEQPTQPTVKPSDSSVDVDEVKTGDDTNIIPYILLGGLGLIGVTCVVVLFILLYKKRH